MPNNKFKAENIVSRTKLYLAIIAILLVILCVLNQKFIIPSIIVFLAIVIYTIWSSNKRKTELSEQINELTLNIDKAAQSTIINSPFPLVIIESDGNIIWKSSKFVSEFKNIDIGTYLNDIIKELKIEIENNQDNKDISIKEKMKIGSKFYKVIGEYVKVKDKNNTKSYLSTIYFIDETDYTEILNKYNEEKTSVGIIMIDNYEELLQSQNDDERALILSNIEQSIYAWINKYEGIAIKTERDKFVCIFEKKKLNEIREQRFNILDEIKEIKTTEKITPTLSIAVSIDGENNFERYASAKEVINIALGRGGDQAIIKEDEKFTFFGGKTQEVEKLTKVRARTVAHALKELIENSSKVIIMGHTNGDMDAIGASTGVYSIAKSLGKEAYIVVDTIGNNLESFLTDLKTYEEFDGVILNKDEAVSKADENTLVVVVDTHKRNYVASPELLTKTEKIVVIDHHRRGTDYIEEAILTFHEVYASSSCELVTELLEYSEPVIDLTQFEAEALYAGIMMDTKNFTFKTGVRTFEAAAYLRRCGVDTIRVKKWFQSDFETYGKISEIVSNAEIVEDTIAIALYDKDDVDANVTCAKAADELLTINNITASFVIGKTGDKIFISGRSIGDINVQVILEKLGGGGHITVAGTQLENVTIEEAKQELIIRINEYFTEINN